MASSHLRLFALHKELLEGRVSTNDIRGKNVKSQHAGCWTTSGKVQTDLFERIGAEFCNMLLVQAGFLAEQLIQSSMKMLA